MRVGYVGVGTPNNILSNMACRILGVITRHIHDPLKSGAIANVFLCQKNFSTTSVNRLKEGKF